ncbi:MAG: glycoside hydrolase family 97 catalytic domain-containing protein, partial [Bacteroidota bacterium]
TTWTSLRAQSEIRKIPIAQLSDSSAVERPFLAQLSDSLFVTIGEAGLVDYARMKLLPDANKPGTLVSDLASEVQSKGNLQTPWRVVMAGQTAGEILENNYLLLNLNEPNKIDDNSWIRPGKVIREVTLTTDGGMACEDFAVKHNLQFIEFDAGWYGNEYDDTSDATTVTVDPKRSDGPLELQRVIDYAKSKGIGVILYVNRRALEKQLDEVLPLLQFWGVQGVKYGFVNVGSQEWTSWLHDAVRKAADHQLMIDIHDEYRPTGYSRTYPNLMTQEGIRGDEESPMNDMVLKTLFTRMVAGAGDQTNCYFAERVNKMGSHASQLAKAVCIYSPWQFLYWYDRPAGSPGKKGGAGSSEDFIQEVPELAFYDALPTVWDDTKIINGYPGEYATVARKAGNDWFVGVLTGTTDYQVSFSLDFLDEGVSYEATIYSDDPSLDTDTKVRIETMEVNRAMTVF